MIHVDRDLEGQRTVFAELLSADFDRARITRSLHGASAEQRRRVLAGVPEPSLSPGYAAWCRHVMQLEAQGRVGIAYGALTAAEAAALQVLADERVAFNNQHPSCPACGVRQGNRFGRQCAECGVKFRQRGDK